MNISTVGIVGAGTMGNGIAQACAVSGINVVMVDIAQAAVDKGVATVGKSLDRLLQKEKITEADKAAALGRIKGSTNYDDLKGAQLVIEAATENHELKNKILKQLDGLLAPEVIIATNTSSISITQLAAVTSRPVTSGASRIPTSPYTTRASTPSRRSSSTLATTPPGRRVACAAAAARTTSPPTTVGRKREKKAPM